MTRLLLCTLIVLAAGSAQPARAQEDSLVRTALTGSVFEYAVATGDTLGSISARFGAGVTAIVELNGIRRQDKLVPGQVLTIDNRHLAVVEDRFQITLNIPQRLLFLAEGDTVSAFPIAVGLRSWPTPVGSFTVVDKEENPTWDVPVSIQQEMRAKGKPVITRMPPSPENPLGMHWIRTSLPGIGIHGTIAPSSIYNYASHGCIRMHPDDVALLFEKVAPGTTGASIYRPVTIARIDDRVFVEAHPDGYRRGPLALAHVQAMAERDGYAEMVDWPAVERVLRLQRGLAVDVTKDE